MNFRAKLYLQKCLFINSCVYFVWVCTVAFFFYIKVTFQVGLTYYVSLKYFFIISSILWFQNNKYDHLIKYLSITLFIMFTMIECIRLYLGQIGNLLCRVPELASFLMLSLFMQMPLITYFLFNPYLRNTPIEVTLHAVMLVTILTEIVLSFQALKQASSIAKSIYFSCLKTRI